MADTPQTSPPTPPAPGPSWPAAFSNEDRLTLLLARERMGRAELAFKLAEKDAQAISLALKAKYSMDDRDIFNPESGAITRYSSAPPVTP